MYSSTGGLYSTLQNSCWTDETEESTRIKIIITIKEYNYIYTGKTKKGKTILNTDTTELVRMHSEWKLY